MGGHDCEGLQEWDAPEPGVSFLRWRIVNSKALYRPKSRSLPHQRRPPPEQSAQFKQQ